MDILRFAFLGVGIGGAYGLLTLGVVTIYRGTGVPNFAQGAIAMISAYLFFDLRDDHGFNQLEAFVVTAVFAVLLGVCFHFAVMRQLQRSPMLAKIVATLALVLLLQGCAILAFGATTTTPAAVLPDNVHSILSVNMPEDRLYLAGIAVVAAIVLGIWSKRTRLGLAVRAVSESQTGTQVSGYSPDLLSAITWGAGSLLAAIAGILISPTAGLDSQALTLLVVPVLGAALIARFSSYTKAVAAGLVIGAIQSVLQFYGTTGPWWSDLWRGPGRSQAFPAILVLVVMLLSGRLIPSRGDLGLGRLPISPLPRHLRWGPFALLGVGAIALATLNDAWVFATTQTIIFGLVALSLVLLAGYMGQLSLAQMAFAGLGGLIAARLAGGTVHWPFLATLIVAPLCAGLIGLAVGVPALRVRGPSLAIVTLSIGLICQTLVFNDDWLVGSGGSPRVPAPELFGWTLSDRWFGELCMLIVVLVGVGLAFLRKGRFGRRALAIRENERAAVAAGINLNLYKFVAFALSAAIAGLAGVLWDYQTGVFTYNSYDILSSLQAIVLIYIGGIGMVSGAIMAAIGADGGIFSQILAKVDLSNYQQVIAGAALLIAVQLHPDGIASLGEVVRKMGSQRGRGTPSLSSGSTAPPGLAGEAAEDRAEVTSRP